MDKDPARLVPPLEQRLLHASRRRDRYLAMFASGLLTDEALLRSHLDTLAQEEDYLRRRIEEIGAGASDHPPQGREADRRRARTQYGSLWGDRAAPHATAYPLLDDGKRAFLKGLRVTLRVLIHPRETRKRAPGNTHRYGGLTTLTLEADGLGLTGRRAVTLTETPEAARMRRPRLKDRGAAWLGTTGGTDA
jgi:hypothetical protein